MEYLVQMSNVNIVTISGNLAADPELKGQAGKVAALRVAVNESRKDDSGEFVETPHFFEASVLGNFAGVVDRKMRKGDRITLTGKLEQQRWETPEGDKRSKVAIIVRDIDSPALFLKDEDVKPKDDGSSSNQFVPAASAAQDDDIPF